MSYTLLTPKARDTALACARGYYQEGLIWGHKSWAGSDLKGAAARSGGSYAASRESLIARLQSAGLYVERTKGARGITMMVIMTAAEGKRAKDCSAAQVAAQIIERAEKSRARALAKAIRDEARAARELAEDIPALDMLAHAR
ncbi:hypothetical protein ACLBX9_07070 [Methylobacterium sp. A49B]